MGDESAVDKAFLGITLRQLAPELKRKFEWYAVKHNVPFHEVVLIARYKQDMDLDDPKAAQIEFRHVKGTIAESLESAQAAEGTSEMTLLQQMFPVFKEYILAQAATWNVSKYAIFLMACYIQGKDINDADSIDLQFRVRGRNDLAKRIE